MTTAVTTYTRQSLDDLAEAVDRAQEVYELIDWTSFLDSGAAVPCPGCGGRGQTNNGVFGQTECFDCGGKKVVDGEASDAPPEPPFRLWRGAVTNARHALQARTNAVRDRLLMKGTPPDELAGAIEREVAAKAQAGTLGLPAIVLPSLEELKTLRDELKAKAKAATQKRLAGGARGALSRPEPQGRLGRGEEPSRFSEDADPDGDDLDPGDAE